MNDKRKPMIEELEKKLFTPGGKPKCPICGKAMKNYTPTSGKFKGELQKYSWVCDCKDFPKGLVMSVG